MAIEVFNRYEKKYLLDSEAFRRLQGKLSGYMELDEYNKRHQMYTVTNLYYDTPSNHLISTSLKKPKYKEKLRLRAYGVPSSDTMIYAEIKKKVDGLVNKRRSALMLNEAYVFLESGVIPSPRSYQNRQALHEIDYILKYYELRSALYLAYDRIAYFGIGRHDIRVSFDCNIRKRRYDLRLEAGDYGSPLLEDGMWLMEIKTSQSIPLWLCSLLSEDKIYPVSFSKYGREYIQMLERERPQAIYAFVYSKQLSGFKQPQILKK